MPLFNAGRKFGYWPKMVSDDVHRHMNVLKSTVFVVAGQTRGKTLLPLPAGADNPDFEKQLDG